MEKIDHIAIVVNNINRGVDWFTKNRYCKVKYQDSSWALLELQNVDLILSIIGISGWVGVSIAWKDRALIMLNTVGLFFLLRNLVTLWVQ